MRIERVGALVIGAVLLSVGLVVLGSDIDPNVICFKSCDAQKALSSVFGTQALRLVICLIFSAIGLLFLLPSIRKPLNKKSS